MGFVWMYGSREEYFKNKRLRPSHIKNKSRGIAWEKFII